MAKFEVKIDKASPAYRVHISGAIDEDIDFSPYSLSGASSVDFELGQIKSINSCGIREWIKWISTAAGAPVVYNECPKVIVDQINMVQGFLPSQGKVKSFYVPYFSEETESEKNILFREGAEYSESGIRPPAEVKDDKGHVMEMDVVEAKYFKFLQKK